jgi:hypothetical protein
VSRNNLGIGLEYYLGMFPRASAGAQLEAACVEELSGWKAVKWLRVSPAAR